MRPRSRASSNLRCPGTLPDPLPTSRPLPTQYSTGKELCEIPPDWNQPSFEDRTGSDETFEGLAAGDPRVSRGGQRQSHTTSPGNLPIRVHSTNFGGIRLGPGGPDLSPGEAGSLICGTDSRCSSSHQETAKPGCRMDSLPSRWNRALRYP
jgi:hypothetical protein